MLRVGLAVAAGVVVVGAMAFALRPQTSSVEARPFPPAASELRELWASAPRARQPLPPTVGHGGGTTTDTRVVLDRRLASGRRLELFVERRPTGDVCLADTLGTAGCFTSFENAGANLGSLHLHGANLLTGVLRDGTTGVDVEILDRWRPANVSGRAVHLDLGRRNLGMAITRVRYHLADGSTRTCELWTAC